MTGTWKRRAGSPDGRSSRTGASTPDRSRAGGCPDVATSDRRHSRDRGGPGELPTWGIAATGVPAQHLETPEIRHRPMRNANVYPPHMVLTKPGRRPVNNCCC